VSAKDRDVMRGTLTAEEQRTAMRLKKEGRNAEYIRGWLYAGRKVEEKKNKL